MYFSVPSWNASKFLVWVWHKNIHASDFPPLQIVWTGICVYGLNGYKLSMPPTPQENSVNKKKENEKKGQG